MLWANVDGQRQKATRRTPASCPDCGRPVIAKCGQLVRHHWAHKGEVCPFESQPETDWHRGWKELFPPEMQEVTIGNRRADVKTPHGVIEFQHSSISSEELKARESDYGKRLVWVIDLSKAKVEWYLRRTYADPWFRWNWRYKAFDFSWRPIVFDLRNNPSTPSDHKGLVLLQAANRRRKDVIGQELSAEEFVEMALDPDSCCWSDYTFEQNGVYLHARKMAERRLPSFFHRGRDTHYYEVSHREWNGHVVLQRIQYLTRTTRDRKNFVMTANGFVEIEDCDLFLCVPRRVHVDLPRFDVQRWLTPADWALDVQVLYAGALQREYGHVVA